MTSLQNNAGKLLQISPILGSKLLIGSEPRHATLKDVVMNVRQDFQDEESLVQCSFLLNQSGQVDKMHLSLPQIPLRYQFSPTMIWHFFYFCAQSNKACHQINT